MRKSLAKEIFCASRSNFTIILVGKPKYSPEVIKKFKKVILLIQFVTNYQELYKFKGLVLKHRIRGC